MSCSHSPWVWSSVSLSHPLSPWTFPHSHPLLLRVNSGYPEGSGARAVITELWVWIRIKGLWLILRQKTKTRMSHRKVSTSVTEWRNPSLQHAAQCWLQRCFNVTTTSEKTTYKIAVINNDMIHQSLLYWVPSFSFMEEARSVTSGQVRCQVWHLV